jgi:PAS domain S-box-containing protein
MTKEKKRLLQFILLDILTSILLIAILLKSKGMAWPILFIIPKTIALYLFYKVKEEPPQIIEAPEAPNDAKFLAFMHNHKDAIWCVDADFNLTHFNDVFGNLYKSFWKKEIQIGQTILLPDSKHGIYKLWNSWYAKALKEEAFSFNFDYDFREGKKYFKVTFTTYIESNGTTGIIVNANDYTQRKLESILKDQQSEFLNKLISHLPLGIFVKNVKQGLTYTLWNKELESIYGIEQSLVIGRTDEEVFNDGGEIKRYTQIDKMIIKDKEPILIQKLNIEKGESTIIVKTYKIPILDAHGEVELILGIVEDITDVIKQDQELENASKRWNYALSGSRDAVWDVNLVTDESFFSPILNEILGFKSFETIPYRWEEMVHPEDIKTAWEAFVNHLEGKTHFYEQEYRMLKKDGSFIWILDRGKIAETDAEGNPTRVIGTFSNINYRKQLEEEYRITLEKAEEANRAKSLFLSTISHEIRTPMNGVIGIINLLLSENPKREQRENLNALKYSADNLMYLLNDILDFSKIDAGKMDIETSSFNLIELVQNSLKSFAGRANEKNLKLQLKTSNNIPTSIIGDVTRLSQIFGNLISNAIKFTLEGQVTVELLTKKRDEEEISIQFNFKDTGMGIEKGYLPQIFEQFTQASNETTRKFGGTGLGLAICKRLVEIMGGQLEVKSEVNKGTYFWFTLTFKINAEQKISTASSVLEEPPKAFENLSVLLVEDNQMNVYVASKFLDRWKTKISLAHNGKEAVKMVQENTYDFILMDLQMPEMDGFEATKKIREMQITTPIFALTANVNADARSKVLESGMNDYISKPFNPEELITKISGVLFSDKEKKPISGDLRSLL